MHLMRISNIPERDLHEKDRMRELGEEHGEVISEGPDDGLDPESKLLTPDDEVAAAWESEGKIVDRDAA